MFNYSYEIDENKTDDFQYSFDVPIFTNFNDNMIDDVHWFQNRFSEGVVEEINIDSQFNNTMNDITLTELKMFDNPEENKLNELIIPIIEDHRLNENEAGNLNERPKSFFEEIRDIGLSSLNVEKNNNSLEIGPGNLYLLNDANISKNTMGTHEMLICDNMEKMENIKVVHPPKTIFIVENNKENIEENVKHKNGKVIRKGTILKEKALKNQKFSSPSKQLQKISELKIGPKRFDLETCKPKPLAEIKVNDCVRNQTKIKLAGIPSSIKRKPTIPLSPKLMTKVRAEQKLKKEGHGIEKLERHSANSATKGASLEKQSSTMQNKTKVGAVWK